MSAAGHEPSSFRLALTLGVAGLLSGLAIVTVFEVTAPMIAANRARALREAVLRVVPGATRMQAHEGAERAEGDGAVYAAYDDDGLFRGYAIVGEGPGFQDTIRLIYGYDPSRATIVGMEVLESRETPGLGDKIAKDEEFVSSFDSLSVDPRVVLVKPGESQAENEVDAITGATISSRAVVDIINASNETWLEQLPESGGEPELRSEAP
jgi:electron transport complex protein RnfG